MIVKRSHRFEPRVSVVMPVYNAQQTVARAMASVLASELSDFELIVVNDGSTDQTAEVVRTIDDDRIRLVQTVHRGIVPALNRGVNEARAAWIARMDADDISPPDRLARQWERFKEGDVQIVGSRVRVVDPQGCPAPGWQRYEQWINEFLEPEEIAAYRFVESPLVHPSVLARRDVFELGYRQGPWPEDYDLWLRAIQAGYRACKIAEPHFVWTDLDDRLTRRNSSYTREAFERCRRMHLLSGPLENVRTVDLWGAGRRGKTWLRWLQANDRRVRQLIDVSLRRVGETIHSVKVLAPEQLPKADGVPLLIAVGAEGARDLIRDHLGQRGYVPGRDAWFVA